MKLKHLMVISLLLFSLTYVVTVYYLNFFVKVYIESSKVEK